MQQLVTCISRASKERPTSFSVRHPGCSYVNQILSLCCIEAFSGRPVVLKARAHVPNKASRAAAQHLPTLASPSRGTGLLRVGLLGKPFLPEGPLCVGPTVGSLCHLFAWPDPPHPSSLSLNGTAAPHPDYMIRSLLLPCSFVLLPHPSLSF